MKRWKKISDETFCGSCKHFIPHYVQMKDKSYFQCLCGQCPYRPEKGCYLSWTNPCERYQPGYRPIFLRLKRHAFLR